MVKRAKIKSNIIFLLFSIIVLIILKPERLSQFSAPLNLSFSVLILINVIFFLSNVINNYKTWLRYDVLFLIGFLIVHFQIPLLASLNVEPENPNYIWINKDIVNFASWLSSVSISLWLVGFLLYSNGGKEKRIIVEFNKRKSTFFYYDLVLLLLLISFLYTVGGDFLSGSYSGTRNYGEGAVYILLLLRIALYLRLIYFFRLGKFSGLGSVMSSLIRNKLLFIVVVLYLLIFLQAGDRGPIMQLVILILGGYSIFVKKISFRFLLVVIAFGAVLFTLIRYGRTRDASQRELNIVSQGIENFTNNDVPFNPTNELATSVRILYRALDVVPTSHPFLFGETFVADLVGIIPFGASTYISLYRIPTMYTSSSNFFTYLGQGPFPNYGEGSEIIGDIYINFGVLGVFILMFGFGYLVSFLSYKTFHQKSFLHTIVYLLLLTGSIYINRSNFLDPAKLVVWALIINFLFLKSWGANGTRKG